jgi:hypothetical protein
MDMFVVNGASIGVKITRVAADDSLLIYYSGKPADLVAACTIAPELLAIPPKGKTRTDADGDRCFVTRTQSGTVILCRHKFEQKALVLPGVLQWLLNERGTEVRTIVDQALVKFSKAVSR